MPPPGHPRINILCCFDVWDVDGTQGPLSLIDRLLVSHPNGSCGSYVGSLRYLSSINHLIVIHFDIYIQLSLKGFLESGSNIRLNSNHNIISYIV